MELNGAKILYTIHTNIPVLGDFKITQTLVSTWIVMALLSGLAFWLGRDLKLENVSKRQAAAEFIVERLDQFVHDNMGLHFDQYIPLVGAIFALSIGCNLISVVGLWSPTADLNTEADQEGKLIRPNFVTEHFDWLLTKYGLKHIRFHDLRHSCASLMVMNGVSMKQVQEWLGHSTFSTTADIYAHLDYKSKQGSAGVIANLLGESKFPK